MTSASFSCTGRATCRLPKTPKKQTYGVYNLDSSLTVAELSTILLETNNSKRFLVPASENRPVQKLLLRPNENGLEPSERPASWVRNPMRNSDSTAAAHAQSMPSPQASTTRSESVTVGYCDVPVQIPTRPRCDSNHTQHIYFGLDLPRRFVSAMVYDIIASKTDRKLSVFR